MMLGGTITNVLNGLQNSSDSVTRVSFKEGWEIGLKLVPWTSYNKRTVIKVAAASNYIGARKDRAAYQIGLVAAYLEKSKERLGEFECDLTEGDLIQLGLREKQQESKKKQPTRKK